MARRWWCLLCSLLLLVGGLAGCAPAGKRTVTYMDAFDTVSTITVYGGSQADLDRMHEELLRYHRLFDIYHTYEGVNNLKTVNDAAGGQPVAVDGAIIDLLTFGLEVYDLTDGGVNMLFGPVLQLWHAARTTATETPEATALPSKAALQQAARHVSPSVLEIDKAAGTVRLTDPAARLDVGAIAKGFATQRLADFSRDTLGWTSALLDIGGNICAVGGKGRGGFTIGVQNPDTTSAMTYLTTVEVTDQAVVTSGDYQRYFEMDGQRYHHIIDTHTLYPATFMRGVTVVCDDSAMADALSTALFCLPLEEGRTLLSRVPNARAAWVTADGQVVDAL